MDDNERQAEARRDYLRMLDDLAAGPLQREFIERLTSAAGVTPALFAADFERAKEKRDDARRLKWRQRVGADRR